jgi:glycosyltransferase involved in cell wall biosynthesis
LAKKRIAILIDWYLPGTKAGGPVRSVYSLVKLLQNEYDFHIITTNHDLGSLTPHKKIVSDQWSTYKDIPVYYFSNEALNESSLLKVINDLNPDKVYINSFWSYWFSILPLKLSMQGKLKSDIVLAPRGMLSSGALSLKTFKKRLFIFLAKLRGLHKNVVFHATTAGEENEIRNFFPEAKIRIASNVNTALPITNKMVSKKPGELKLFFLSRVARVKNLHFALEILKEMKSGVITYDIYGSIEDPLYKQECDAIISQLPSNIKVSFKGEVDFDMVQDTIKNYHGLFLPTLNENFGHSIVESLLSACPVIISDQTPWNDINKEGCGFAISLDQKPSFISALEAYLRMDDVEYQKTLLNCITFIQRKISTEEDVKAYKNLFS